MILPTKNSFRWFSLLAFFAAGTCSTQAQRVRGELRLEVRDLQGAALSPNAELVSGANQLRRSFQANPDGHYVAQDLPFGVYRLTLSVKGFAPWTDLVEIRSEVPVRLSVTLGAAPVTTRVEVKDSATLVDPYRTGTQFSIGGQSLHESAAAQPGRNLSDLVDELPGWLYESNGVLHPRGSEYDVQ